MFMQVPKALQQQQQQQKSSSKAGFDLGFTRDNEVFVGRLAMTGFAASVVGEVSWFQPVGYLLRCTMFLLLGWLGVYTV